MIKTMMATSFIILAMNTSLGDEHGKNEKWKSRRDKRVSHLTRKISSLSGHKNCFQSATTRDSFKSCKESARSDHKKWRAEREERKRNRKK